VDPALTGITSNFTSPQIADAIEKRLPAPLTTKAGGVRSGGASGLSEGEGAAGKEKEGGD